MKAKFCKKSVTLQMSHKQFDLLTHALFEYIAVCDQDEIKEKMIRPYRRLADAIDEKISRAIADPDGNRRLI